MQSNFYSEQAPIIDADEPPLGTPPAIVFGDEEYRPRPIEFGKTGTTIAKPIVFGNEGIEPPAVDADEPSSGTAPMIDFGEDSSPIQNEDSVITHFKMTRETWNSLPKEAKDGLIELFKNRKV